MEKNKQDINNSIENLQETLTQIEEDTKAKFTLRYIEDSENARKHSASLRGVLSDLNSCYSELTYRFNEDEHEEVKENIDDLRETVQEMIQS